MMAEVRRHCQTMALAMGLPVALSQMTVVSLWLVMPMAAMSSAVTPSFSMAARETSSVVVQISSASCSTQPGKGKIWRNSFWAVEQMFPAWSKRMQRELVVPWSRDMIYFIATLLWLARPVPGPDVRFFRKSLSIFYNVRLNIATVKIFYCV